MKTVRRKVAKKASIKRAASVARRGPSRGINPTRSTSKDASINERQDRAARTLRALRDLYSDADCALRHRSALELLVATILSAQCTDERVNLVTPALFAKYRTARDFAQAEPAELEQLIRSTGFFRNKTKNLIGMGQALCQRFDGQVPNRMDDLLTLPGVARKTANCVLGTWFRQNEGVVVDTHVGRLAVRLGLTANSRDSKDAVRIERELCELFPRESWTYLSHALIQHGRRVCFARKPNCSTCSLAVFCPSAAIATK